MSASFLHSLNTDNGLALRMRCLGASKDELGAQPDLLEFTIQWERVTGDKRDEQPLNRERRQGWRALRQQGRRAPRLLKRRSNSTKPHNTHLVLYVFFPLDLKFLKVQTISLSWNCFETCFQVALWYQTNPPIKPTHLSGNLGWSLASSCNALNSVFIFMWGPP